MRVAHPKVGKKHALALTAWTINQTAGTHCLVHSLLVFRELPRLPAASTALQAQRASMPAVYTIRAAVLRLLARARGF